MFYWNPKATKCKYKKKVTKIIKTSKTKVVVGANLSIGKKDQLYNTYYYDISEKWTVKKSRFYVSLIISLQVVPIFATSHHVGCIKHQCNCEVILRTRLKRVQLQHHIKQLGLSIHSKTPLVRILTITQKPRNPQSPFLLTSSLKADQERKRNTCDFK